MTERSYVYYQENEIAPNNIIPWPSLKSLTITPNLSTVHNIRACYEYVLYGNLTKETTEAPNFSPLPEPRITQYHYEENGPYSGRFITEVKMNLDGVDYVTSSTYDPVKCVKTSDTDPAMVQYSYSYDPFNMLTESLHPDNTKTSNKIYWIDGTGGGDEYAPIS